MGQLSPLELYIMGYAPTDLKALGIGFGNKRVSGVGRGHGGSDKASLFYSRNREVGKTDLR